MASPPKRLLFIASIGNPKPYRRTRHSAGHLLLDVVAPLLKARYDTSQTLYTTWYSPSYMNESGPKLVRQMTRWLATQDSNILSSITLVILHDELEAAPGKVRVKRGGPEIASLRGHRGLISIFETLRGKGLYPPREQNSKRRNSTTTQELSILRIGIGIGRPESREKNAVADYVLSEMNAWELGAVERAAEPVMKAMDEEMCRSDIDL
ncbi:hypothetical protein N7495_008969 [Penicillium taxi]|uniref:uncharacterized protein n=1 Tax=Penicillium taxi TaxID=168475 RepID=UPI002544F0BA|nr:uncharacterized protein N7495_008969 [Penicillium taxi]KAJ5888928.1 hypothetical protein N7495_008969 [Penicillium taxi]